MKSNRTQPQRPADVHSFGSDATLEEDCCGECCRFRCSTRRAICVTATVLLCLLLAVVGCVLALHFGIPKPPPVNRVCRTTTNGTGFLCDDKLTCIAPSDLCNGVMDCLSGTDEDGEMCSDLPNSLPGYLVFQCGNPKNWIFIDKKCNHINDCGDCSDEIQIYAGCPSSCGAGWWQCTPVDFQYCECIPSSLCRDGRQHCHDWSDEYTCPKVK